MEGCPYCQKVRKKAEELGLDFIWRNYQSAKGEDNWAYKIGGKAQVPLLVDQSKDVVMYESDDIIQYLEDNYS